MEKKTNISTPYFQFWFFSIKGRKIVIIFFILIECRANFTDPRSR